MPTFLLSHHHSPSECGRAYAAWRGFRSPLRHQDALSTCPLGGHGLWWFVEAADPDAALGQLPESVGHQTEVIRVSRVPIPEAAVTAAEFSVALPSGAPACDYVTMSTATLPRHDGRLLRSTRLAVAGLLVLAILNAGFLYFLPVHADTGYAWAIVPPVSAAFLGAGYLAGVVATALVVFVAQRWRSVQPLAVALFTLSIGLLAATLLHTDRFKWEYAPTWGWTAVYALAPIGVVVLSLRQRAITLRPMLADPRLNLLRVLSLVAGLALGAYAIALFAFPASLGAHWPWPQTPLLAQADASWMAMIAAALLWCAYDLRRASEAFIPYATLGAWCLALLALPALHADDLTHTGAPLLTYLGALSALLALAVLGMTRTGRLSL